MNVVVACKRCNQYKSGHLLEDISLSLIALPYRANVSEYLALASSKRILPEQTNYLRNQFSKNFRWGIAKKSAHTDLIYENTSRSPGTNILKDVALHDVH